VHGPTSDGHTVFLSHCSHVCIIVHRDVASKQPVCPICSVEPPFIVTHSLLLANRSRDAQLIRAGKGYGMMYSIWKRFHDIISHGSRHATDRERPPLPPTQAQLQCLPVCTSLTAVSSQHTWLHGGLPQPRFHRAKGFGFGCRTSSDRGCEAVEQGPQRDPQFTGSPDPT